ncbi:hypothetical protein [Bradyrhizobium jicamae]|uniref:hypothetical protein n=1 Tax=Bradyrhizobium jicamae TaxID=280332 RepID=UPI0012EEA451|nr:hypothetical protein [Bradyrhizobium jicamae]
MRLLQPLGVKAKFLGHLNQLLRGFWILHGFGEPPGPGGLLSVVVGLGHRSTFLDECGWRQKGSTVGIVGNGILRRQSCRKMHPLFVPEEQKESFLDRCLIALLHLRRTADD